MPYKSEILENDELEKLFRLWAKGTGVTFEQWLDLRDRCRKDLYFLGKNVLKKDLVPHVHGEPCREFLVQKNFDGVYHAGYTLEEVHRAIERQDPIHERVWLDPRGSYKSTIHGLDCTQWLLNCPDIRILILTGESTLGSSMLREIKHYFHLPEDSEPTEFHRLFPEYIVRGDAGENRSPLVCPARRHFQKEASVWSNGVTATLSGWHCDILAGDDFVNDENSGSEDSRATVKAKYDNASNLVDQWGFQNHIGTRYDPDDWFGHRLKVPQDEAPYKILLRSAWTPKPGYENVALKDLTEDMVTLLFPEKLSYRALRKILFRDGERLFRCQQLNQPVSGLSVSFDEDVLRAHFEPKARVEQGPLCMTWDTALTETAKADFSACCVARHSVDKQICNVLEIQCDRWKQSELAVAIVLAIRKWRPDRILIEKPSGDELFRMELQRVAQKYGVSVANIFWLPIDKRPNAKANRIKGLETLLAADRLWFVSGSWMDQTVEQFVKYTGERKNKGHKDDIPDAVSMQQVWLAAAPVPVADAEEVRKKVEEERKKLISKLWYERIFETPSDAEMIRKALPKEVAPAKQSPLGTLPGRMHL